MNWLFDKLKHHIGHEIECVGYGDGDKIEDICLECVDCCEVLVSTQTIDEEEDDEYGWKGK